MLRHHTVSPLFDVMQRRLVVVNVVWIARFRVGVAAESDVFRHIVNGILVHETTISSRPSMMPNDFFHDHHLSVLPHRKCRLERFRRRQNAIHIKATKLQHNNAG